MGRDSKGTLGAWAARLWARRILIFAAALLGLLAGLAATRVLPTRYAATAVVNVAPLTVNQFGSNQATQAVNMESERSAVTSASVLTRAAAAGGTDAAAATRGTEAAATASDPEALRDSLTVVVPSGSLILKVTSTTRDAAQSAHWANAVAEAYLLDRAASADDAARRIIARLQGDIDDRLRARAAQAPADRALTDQDVASLRERISTLTTVGLNPGRVITPAATPTEPSSLGAPALIVGGQALGLLAGVCAALLADRIGRRVRSRARLAWATGWPVREVRGDVTPAAVHAVERAVALRPTEGPARFAVLDLTGRGCPEVLDELTTQLRDLRAGVGGLDATILDLSDIRRPSIAAAHTREGDVALVCLDAATPMAVVDDVAEILTARGATVAAALLHRAPAGDRVADAAGAGPASPAPDSAAGPTPDAAAGPASDHAAVGAPTSGAGLAEDSGGRVFGRGAVRRANRKSTTGVGR